MPVGCNFSTKPLLMEVQVRQAEALLADEVYAELFLLPLKLFLRQQH